MAATKLTMQGQISVPAEVRRRLGVGPGSTLEWEEENGSIVVRRAGRFTSLDIHEAVFGSQQPKPRSLDELKQGLRKHITDRHARG